MRIRALLAVLAVALLAACSSPTAPAAPAAPNAALMQPDTELGFGSPAIGTGL